MLHEYFSNNITQQNVDFVVPMKIIWLAQVVGANTNTYIGSTVLRALPIDIQYTYSMLYFIPCLIDRKVRGIHRVENGNFHFSIFINKTIIESPSETLQSFSRGKFKLSK